MDRPSDPQSEPESNDAAEQAREQSRESTFLSAIVSFDGSPRKLDVRVRNVSAGGMMVDMAGKRETGAALTVELKNIGEVRGTVAWSTENRMGISFDEEIDPQLARYKPTAIEAPGYKRPYTEPRRPGLSVR